MCYHAQFGCSLKTVVRQRRNRKIGKRWSRPLAVGMRREWPVEIRPSTTCTILPKLVVLGQAVPALLIDPPEKFDPRVPPFKVTHGLRNWHVSICHLWFPINVPATMGLSRSVSEINGNFEWKSQKFSHIRVFNVPAKGVPLQFGIGAWNFKKKTKMMGLPGRERSLRRASAVWIQYTNVTNGQTLGDSKDHAYT